MSDARGEAMELQLDACVAEAMGLGPPADLAARVAARLRAATAGDRAAGRRWWVAAALVLGVGIVATTAWWKRDAERQAAVPPAGPQDPPAKPASLDAAEQQRFDAAMARLGNADQRARAIQELAALGPRAAQRLGEALTAAKTKQDTALIAALQLTIQRLPFGTAARNFHLPAEPVTLVADYSDNRVALLDTKGNALWNLDDVYGAWDAELTAAGTMLITEFSVSRVSERDAHGNTVWEYDDLKNSYRASRLANGNTLIADTFGSRVIEVTPHKQIAWEYADNVRPFDCERLANGNTLIADVLADRVIEVNPKGEIVWKVEGMNNVHAADRLPDGNTLITLCSKGTVLEVDREGRTAWERNDLTSPSDAVRLPDGNTLVAENGQVREFDPEKRVVWRAELTWCVAAKRY